MEGKKVNKQLTSELARLRDRIRELEVLQSGREAIETELRGARQRYQHRVRAYCGDTKAIIHPCE